MDYFYAHPNDIAHDTITIAGDEYSHLTHVMRKKAGDIIGVVDGEGMAYQVILEDLKKHTATGTIRARFPRKGEPSIRVTLGVGVLKNPSRFDFLVEKATEIGVHDIVPLFTERTITGHAKEGRWQKLALAAMKQCGRSYLPRITSISTFNAFLERPSSPSIKLIAHEHLVHASWPEESTPSGTSVCVLVGPEGGFSDQELEAAMSYGYQAVYLGDRRLRTETAALVLLSRLLMHRPG